MMDVTPLYPNGFRTYGPTMDRTGLRLANPLKRYEVDSVRYLVIDFGLSTLFDESTTNRLVTGDLALDLDVPELSEDVPYDPFLVDVFTLGNLFKKTFVRVYTYSAHTIHVLKRVSFRSMQI